MWILVAGAFVAGPACTQTDEDFLGSHAMQVDLPRSSSSVIFGPLAHSLKPGLPFQAHSTERFVSRARQSQQPAERLAIVSVDGRGRTRFDALAAGVATLFAPARGAWTMRASMRRARAGSRRSWSVRAAEEIAGELTIRLHHVARAAARAMLPYSPTGQPIPAVLAGSLQFDFMWGVLLAP